MSSLLTTVRLDKRDVQALRKVVPPSCKLVHLHEAKGSLDDVLPEVEVLLCAGVRSLTRSMMQGMRSLRMVQTLLAGADHIPPELFRPEVAVCTTSGAGSHHVAEHALAFLMAAAKNVVAHTLSIREGMFDRSPENLSMRGRALGVLGLGSVGRIVASLGRALGMRVLAINRTGRTREPVDFIGTLDDLGYLLQNANYLVICLPLTRKTEGLIGREELGAMKRNAVLVNVGRGRVVQEKALYQHLAANSDSRGAFDVWWSYPTGGTGRPFNLPFEELGNFIMTPHVGGHVPGHRKEMLSLAIENIGNYFMDKPLINRVEEEDSLPDANVE